MALWKAEDTRANWFPLSEPTRVLDLVSLVAIAAAPGFMLLILVPLPLVIPLYSILSFVAACAAAAYAHWQRTREPEKSAVFWQIAFALTCAWVAAAMLSSPRQFIEFLDRLVVVS